VLNKPGCKGLGAALDRALHRWKNANNRASSWGCMMFKPVAPALCRMLQIRTVLGACLLSQDNQQGCHLAEYATRAMR
jgi:hypothetical protein